MISVGRTHLEQDRQEGFFGLNTKYQTKCCDPQKINGTEGIIRPKQSRGLFPDIASQISALAMVFLVPMVQIACKYKKQRHMERIYPMNQFRLSLDMVSQHHKKDADSLGGINIIQSVLIKSRHIHTPSGKA